LLEYSIVRSSIRSADILRLAIVLKPQLSKMRTEQHAQLYARWEEMRTACQKIVEFPWKVNIIVALPASGRRTSQRQVGSEEQDSGRDSSAG